MKKRLINSVFVLLVLQTIITFNAAAEVKYSQELYGVLSDNVNKIPYIDVSLEYERVELDNGMVVYLMEDHELPLMIVNGYIKGGRSREKTEIAGISSIMVDMMNTGTKQYGERELEHYKEVNAIRFGMDVSNDIYSFGGTALISEKDELISLAADILRNPDFKADYFSRIMNEWEKGLNQSKTEEDSLVNMYFYNNIFKAHPYSFNSNLDLRLKALEKINPETLMEYYQKNIIPNNTIFVVYGDINTKEITKGIKNYFGDWKSKEITLKESTVKIDQSNYNKIILVDKADATQARIKMGYNFYAEDYFDNNLEEKVAFNIANEIYGSGDFESHLMKEIRTKKGYAYNISSGYFCGSLGGAYYVNTSVKPDKAYETIHLIKKIMVDLGIKKSKFKEDEISKVVNQWNVGVPGAYKNKSDIFDYIINNIEISKRDINYINDYIKEYNQVSAKKVQNAFTKHVYPSRFVTVIVGRKEDLLPQFEKRGIEVEIINNNLY